MNKRSVQLSEQYVAPDNFFLAVAKYFCRKTGIDAGVSFLMPQQGKGDFILKYPPIGRALRITRQELKIITTQGKQIIFLPNWKLIQQNHSVISLIRSIKLNQKIRAQQLAGIMSVYNNDKVVCLIIFEGKFTKIWFDQHQSSLHELKILTESGLGYIITYNQALEKLRGKAA